MLYSVSELPFDVQKILQGCKPVFTVAEAARVFEQSLVQTQQTLAEWCKKSYLKRIKSGLYVQYVESILKSTLPLSWIVMPYLFQHAYIGGWSAASYWGLAPRSFEEIEIFTTYRSLGYYKVFPGGAYTLKKHPIKRHFGIETVREGELEVPISDPTKTMVDILGETQFRGGPGYVIHCLTQYLKSEHCDIDLLIQYADASRGGGIFKRLGYLSSELLGMEHPLPQRCRAFLKTGYASFYGTSGPTKVVKVWYIVVPQNLQILPLYSA